MSFLLIIQNPSETEQKPNEIITLALSRKKQKTWLGWAVHFSVPFYLFLSTLDGDFHSLCKLFWLSSPNVSLANILSDNCMDVSYLIHFLKSQLRLPLACMLEIEPSFHNTHVSRFFWKAEELNFRPGLTEPLPPFSSPSSYYLLKAKLLSGTKLNIVQV